MFNIAVHVYHGAPLQMYMALAGTLGVSFPNRVLERYPLDGHLLWTRKSIGCENRAGASYIHSLPALDLQAVFTSCTLPSIKFPLVGTIRKRTGISSFRLVELRWPAQLVSFVGPWGVLPELLLCR